jgi:hypothetical protein
VPDPTSPPTEESSTELSPVEPIAPPGPENTWVEPMPAAPPVPNHASNHGSTEASAPLPEATVPEAPAFSGDNPGPAQDARAAPIPNGGFDHSASGWHGSNSALTLIHGRRGRAVRVSKANSRDAFAIVAGKPIASPKAGARYQAGAFVRSVSPGMFVCLRVEEFGTAKNVVPVTTERCRAATTGWQRLRVDTRTTKKGTKLVFSIRVIAALGGKSFDVDGFRLS